MRRLFLIIVSLFLMTLPLLAGNNPNKKITAYKINKPLSVDGVLDENLYQKPPIKDFIQKEPVEGLPPSEKTLMWVAYDEANIYFCGKFYDSAPDSIDRSLMRRDNITASDWLWVYLDPYNDDRTGYFFAVNAGGSICDGTLYNDGWMDDSWDGIWEGDTKITPEGWNVEIKVPFSQLRFNEEEEMVWGINLNRDIKRKHEMSFYIMVPNEESGFVSRFADLDGLNGIKPKQRIELLPYVVQRAQYLRDRENDPFYKSNQYRTSLGADLKLSIGSALNLDATINPDFGQVEVDPAIVNLSAFENYYNEKRPFFIEGDNIFRFGIGGINDNFGFNFGNPTYYYSRRIGRSPQGFPTTSGEINRPNETRILGAAKLTGKLDESWTIGAVSAITERTFAEVLTPSGNVVEDEVEPLSHYGVLRTQKEFNDGNQALGLIFTSVNRKSNNSYINNLLVDQAYTFGLDGWTFLDEKRVYALNASIVGSHVSGNELAMLRIQQQPYRYFQRPDKSFMKLDSNITSLQGIFSRVMLNKQQGSFFVNASLGTASPGFEHNELGFQRYADRINGHIVTGYRWYQPDDIFRRKNLYVGINGTSNYDGDMIAHGLYSSIGFQFVNFWGVTINSSYNFESVNTTLTRGGPKVKYPYNYSVSLRGYTDSSKELKFNPFGTYWHNGFGDYDYECGLEIEWRPQSNITLSLAPAYYYTMSNYQWVDAITDVSAAKTFGKRYIFAALDQQTYSAEVRVNWSFTPKLSLQVYLQPLFSTGEYSTFKELAEPNSKEYNVYGTDGSSITYDETNDLYHIDPDGNGPATPFDIYNQNFNYKSLRANLVLRWEVLPGSVFYAVWTHDKVNFMNPGDMSLGRDFKELWNSPANNIFLLKFAYWLDM